MRPCAIQGVPELDSKATPFERFEQFARLIVRVPKAEADKEAEKDYRKKKTPKGGKP
jgi:hypothetical protein